MKIQEKHNIPPIIDAIFYDGINIEELKVFLLSCFKKYDKKEFKVIPDWSEFLLIPQIGLAVPIIINRYYFYDGGTFNVWYFTKEEVNKKYNIIEA